MTGAAAPKKTIDLAEQLAMNLPTGLTDIKRRQFLMWRYEPDLAGKKPRKVPHYTNGQRRNGTQGAPDDLAQMATFGEELERLKAGDFDGIGIAMLPGAGLVGADLDNCYQDGALNPDMAQFIEGTYCEISPSGKGIRAFFFGEYADRKHLGTGVEVFCAKGFLTLTGDRLTTDDIAPLPDAVRAKFDVLFASQREKTSRGERLRDAEANDPVYQRLAERGMVRKNYGGGRIGITCPFESEHTTGDGDADCVYFLPHTNGYEQGNFNCLHAHCTERSQGDFKRAIGIEAGDTWPELLPLAPNDPPPLPIHLWPPVLRDYATEAAAETETPPELPGMLALGCIAAAVQRVATVEIKLGYEEPCCLYVAVVLPPATRKSREHARAIRPVVHWESEMRKHFADEIARAESLVETHKARVVELRKRVVKTTDKFKAKSLAAELAELETEAPVVPIPPRCFTSDVTPEHLGTMMEHNGGTMAIISAEGGIFETIAGRYSNQIPNLDIYLMGHAGDPVRVDRGSRPPVILDNPRLSMVLTIQPDVLAALNTKPGFRGRGLLGRVLFCLPTPRLGSRKGDARPMRADVQAKYDQTISALLDVSRAIEPYILQIEPAAYDIWLAYWREVETDLAEGGAYEHMRDWAGKLPGAVGRIAALFHSSRYPEHMATRRVGVEDMQAAIETGRALAGHAQAAFGQMSSDPAVEDARLLLNWIKRRGLIEFSSRDAQRNYGARFAKAADLEPPLRVLTERGYIRERTTSPENKGGRPPKVFDVNPEVLSVLSALS